MFSECITGAFAMYWLATKQAVCFRRRPILYRSYSILRKYYKYSLTQIAP